MIWYSMIRAGGPISHAFKDDRSPSLCGRMATPLYASTPLPGDRRCKPCERLVPVKAPPQVKIAKCSEHMGRNRKCGAPLPCAKHSVEMIHVCTACHRESFAHTERCDCGHTHFPLLCCPGCDCRSYESAHTEIVLVTPVEIVLTAPPNEAALAEEAQHFVSRSVSSNTRRAYDSDLGVFAAWCASRGLNPLPATPGVVSAYATALALGTVPGPHGEPLRRRASTIARHVSSIAQAHLIANLSSPTASALVKKTLSGIRRELGVAPVQKKAAVSDIVQRMIDSLPEENHVRDSALLLLGFGSAMRRSEIVALNIGDIDIRPQGMLVHIRRSKGDQEGKGQHVRVPRTMSFSYCPVAAVEILLRDLKIAKRTTGPLFLGPHGRRLSETVVADVVKAGAIRLGLDPKEWAAHSLRAGFATSAAEAGVDLRRIQKKTRHKKLDTVMGYVRVEGSWEDDAGQGLLEALEGK